MFKILWLLSVVGLVSCAGLVVSPEQSSPKLHLQIDSGGHKDSVTSIAFTPDGNYLVSAGGDNVVRIWNRVTGKTVRHIRGQVNADREDKIYAIALSPDEKWLAVGGKLSNKLDEIGGIRLYAFANESLKDFLKGHTDTVQILKFSPNSRYLASFARDGTVLIWDMSTHKKLHRLNIKKTWRIKYSEYSVAFTADSKRVVTSNGENIKVWEVETGQYITTLPKHEERVSAIAVSPSDDIIVSGIDDYIIRLWNGKTGVLVNKIKSKNSQMENLNFSPDGQYLLSSLLSNCSGDSCANYPQMLMSMPDGKVLRQYLGHDTLVSATAISLDNIRAATGDDRGTIHIWNMQTGKREVLLQSNGLAVSTVGFSTDGDWLAWGNTPPSGTGELDYQWRLPLTGNIGEPKPISTELDFVRAKTKWQNWSLSWQTRSVVLKGFEVNETDDKILELKDNQQTVARIKFNSPYSDKTHYAYTFTPNGERIISGGSNGVLIGYAKTGEALGRYVGHTGKISAVAISPDGQILASASEDQTVRLWNVETFENIISLFQNVNPEFSQWVAWTPQGYYAASLNGDDMIGWQINRGIDKEPDYYTAAQLSKHYYRPNIVRNAIRLRSAKDAIAQASNTSFNLKQLINAPPPDFDIVKPAHNKTVTQRHITLTLQFTDNPQPLEKTDVYVNVNGRLINTMRFASDMIVEPTGKTKDLEIVLENGKNEIKVEAKNAAGYSSPKHITVFLKETELEKPGILHLLAVGVSKYKHHSMHLSNLKYAHNDAYELHGLLNKLVTNSSNYSEFKGILLADSSKRPTAKNILKALKKLQDKTNREDTVIVFFAGHGINEDDGYYFLPYDAHKTDNDSWENAIHWSHIQQAMEMTKGRRLLFVDTCHSAGAMSIRILKDARAANIFFMSATDLNDENSLSQESSQYEHGIFTYAMLKGLRGDAESIEPDKYISIKELDAYISKEVPKLTRKSQFPISYNPGVKDFNLVQYQY